MSFELNTTPFGNSWYRRFVLLCSAVVVHVLVIVLVVHGMWVGDAEMIDKLWWLIAPAASALFRELERSVTTRGRQHPVSGIEDG